MDSDEEVIVDLFRIGPDTLYGRAVAVQALSWEAARTVCKKVLLVLKFRIRYGLRKGLKALSILWKVLKDWLNPRNPNVLLGGMILVGYLLRRHRLHSINAKVLEVKRTFYKNMIASAATYEEWAHAAKQLEQYIGRRRDADLYDVELVQARFHELRKRRQEGCVEDMMFALRTDLIRNLGNMCNPELHKNRLHTPPLISEYLGEVCEHLRIIKDAPEQADFGLDDKLSFFHEVRHAFGRTALLLSGGAALGAFHLGVVKTLIEHGLLPRVVAGSSVGSIICSFTATRPWVQLQAFFQGPLPKMHFFDEMGNVIMTAHRLLTRGAMQEIGPLQRKMRELIGDMTFQEAYDISGRVLCITVCSSRPKEPPRLLNYLSSPNVVIWSAVTASCAFPGLFSPQELMAKDRFGRLVPYHPPTELGPDKNGGIGARHWRDGSLETDLPIGPLKELFNVNHFIVSQANPHIAPLLRLKETVRQYGGQLASKGMHLLEMEIKHRCNQALEMGFGFYGLAKLFAQDWEGDVTIVMNASLAQYIGLIRNPTSTELKRGMSQGVRATWAKLSAITANSAIELELDKVVADLAWRKHEARKRAREEAQFWRQAEASTDGSGLRGTGLGLGRGRIPSWNTLPRDFSSESLTEDDIAEMTRAGLSAWGALRRPKRKPGEGHSSDSEAENEMTQISWTKAGGPLFRSSSHQVLPDHGDESAAPATTPEKLLADEMGSIRGPRRRDGPPLQIGWHPIAEQGSGRHLVHEPGLGRVESLSGVSVGHELPNVSKEEEFLEGGSMQGGGGSGDAFGMRRVQSYRNLGRWGHRSSHDVRFVLPHTVEAGETAGEENSRFEDREEASGRKEGENGLTRHISLGAGQAPRLNGLSDGAVMSRAANGFGHSSGGLGGGHKGLRPGGGKEDGRPRVVRMVDRLHRTAPAELDSGSLPGRKLRSKGFLRSASERLRAQGSNGVGERGNGWSRLSEGSAPAESGHATSEKGREVVKIERETAEECALQGDEALSREAHGSATTAGPSHVADLPNGHVADEEREREREAAELDEVGQLVESFRGRPSSRGLREHEQGADALNSGVGNGDADGSQFGSEALGDGGLEGTEDASPKLPESMGRRVSSTGQPIGDIPLGQGIQKLAKSDRITVEALEKATEELSGTGVVCAEECLRQLLESKIGAHERARAEHEVGDSGKGQAMASAGRPRRKKSLEAFGSFVAKGELPVP